MNRHTTQERGQSKSTPFLKLLQFKRVEILGGHNHPHDNIDAWTGILSAG